MNLLSRTLTASHIVIDCGVTENEIRLPLVSLCNAQLRCLSNHLHICPTWVAAAAEWSRYRIVAGFVTSSSSVPPKTAVSGNDAR
ncbi:hypothetical protein TNCV_2248371 [Trichonephila clavipes]|nr:hypothetical protein TNCV_2248371 [Trichonephila clavipes]